MTCNPVTLQASKVSGLSDSTGLSREWENPWWERQGTVAERMETKKDCIVMGRYTEVIHTVQLFSRSLLIWLWKRRYACFTIGDPQLSAASHGAGCRGPSYPKTISNLSTFPTFRLFPLVFPPLKSWCTDALPHIFH